MESDPRPWVDALRRSHDLLESLVRPLDADRLSGPSYCSDWTIAQVLSHLGSGAEISLAGLDAAVAGSDPPDRETFPAVWDRWNAKAPAAQVADGLVADERQVAKLESLSDEALGQLHMSFFGMEMDAVAMVGLRLGEHAVHTWDVAVALDPTAQLAPDATALLIDRVPFLASRVGRPSEAGRVRVRTTDPVRDLAVDLGEHPSISPWTDGEKPASVFELPAEALIRLVYGRLDKAHTPEAASASGLDRLREVFPGF